MNCMETRALVEDALDETLSGNQKRALDLHLSRCDGCRAYFAAERNEHRRWFKAMNEPEARRRLPDGFADNFVAAIANANAVPQRRWAFVGLFCRIAAVVAAMLLFAGLTYAAVVAVDELGGNVTEVENSKSNPSESIMASSCKSIPDDYADDSPVAEKSSGSVTMPRGDNFSKEVNSSAVKSPDKPIGDTPMVKRNTSAAAFAAAILSTVNVGLADGVTNALVASDFSLKDSFTNAHCWVNVMTGLRGEEGSPLVPEWDYLVTNKLYCCSPLKTSGSVFFPGRSLMIGNASSEGNFRTYCNNDAELVFNSPGLFLTKGTFYVEGSANKRHCVSGVVTVLAPSSSPFVFRPSYTNMTLQMDAVMYGQSNSAAEAFCPEGKEPFAVNMANEDSVYNGMLKIRCGRKSFFNGRPPVTLNLGTAPVGTLEVCAYSLLKPYGQTDAVTADTLVLNDKACLAIGTVIERHDDGSVSVANGRFVARQDLKLPSGRGKVILMLPEEPMMKAPSYRMPLLSAPAGSVEAEKFEVAAFENGYVPPCRLVVETQDNVDTLYVDWNVVVKISTDEGAMDNGKDDTCLNKANCWSDGLIPHGGVNYVAGVIDGNTNNVRMKGSGPYVFPGKSLSLFPGCTMYCFINDMTVTNLNLLGGTTVKHAKNMYLNIRGEKINVPSGEVYFDTYDTHEIRLHAPLSGAGTLVVRGHATTSSPKGNVRLEVDNPEFKGSIHVTSQWIKNQRNYLWNGIFAEKAQWQTLTLAVPESLGAPLDAFNPKAMLIDTFGELKIERSMSFADVSRGFCFGDAGQVRIPNGKMATFLSQWTLGGEVFIRESGVLALGGPMRFISGKNISEKPQSGKNLLTFPEGGSLLVLSRNSIDGASVTFSNTTSRLILVADTTDEELLMNGVKNVKTDMPFVFPGDSLNIEFALAGAVPLSEKVRRLGLMTVSSKAAAELRNRMHVSVPRSVLTKWMEKEVKETVDDETGDVTFYLSMRPVGFQVIIR